MARRRYRRYRRRSGKWCPNITRVKDAITGFPGDFAQNLTLCSNPVQLNTSVSQVFTAKNFEISFTIEPSDADAAKYIEALCAYIMYVPQGMTVGAYYHEQHPEYIMNYKYLGSPTGISYAYTASGSNMYEGQQFQPIKLRSKLSRKLQTGDQIILLITGNNQSSSNKTINVDGVVRWWTKAN